jgi:hypothetical protein
MGVIEDVGVALLQNVEILLIQIFRIDDETDFGVIGGQGSVAESDNFLFTCVLGA